MGKPGSSQTKRAVAAAEAQAAEAGRQNQSEEEITLQNGIVLKLKTVPAAMVRRVATKVEKPKIPRTDAGKGREEENPTDPEYLDRMDEYHYVVGEATVNVILSMGVEVISVPENMSKIEDDDWTEALEFFEVDKDYDLSTKIGRKLAWLSYYAIAGEPEWLVVLGKISAMIGMTEAEVASAIESFRGGTPRGADNGLPPAEA